MKNFYVVHVTSQQEFNVEEDLQACGLIDVYCARFKTKRKPRHRKAALKDVIESRPLFPRYLFVRFPDQEAWHIVKATKGVIGFVSAGGAPLPVRPEVIEALRERENAGAFDGNEAEIKFKIGDKMQIISGVLQDRVGKFIEMNGKAARLELDCFGMKVFTDIPVSLLKIVG